MTKIITTTNYGGQEFCEIDEFYAIGNIPYKDLYAIQTSTGSWLVLCEIHRVVDPPERRGEVLRVPVERNNLNIVSLR